MQLKPMLFALLLVVWCAPPAHASNAQDADAEPQSSQSSTEEQSSSQPEAQTSEPEQEEEEDAAAHSVIEDIIPSEMISEDLAVDFPIDI